MTIVLASMTGNDSMHELVRDDDGNKVFHTYFRDRELDRPATDLEAAEFWETARRIGGYTRRGAGEGRTKS